MNSTMIKLSAAGVSAALLLSGCEGMTPEESGTSVGIGAGLLAGTIGAAAGLHPGEAAALGAGVGALAGIITYAIAKHEATERQRKIAEANAKRAYAAHQAQLKKHHVRYIAVKTERTSESKGSTSCMVWDTQDEKMVNNTVYDTKAAPPTGSTAKFDSYSAEYVSS